MNGLPHSFSACFVSPFGGFKHRLWNTFNVIVLLAGCCFFPCLPSDIGMHRGGSREASCADARHLAVFFLGSFAHSSSEFLQEGFVPTRAQVRLSMRAPGSLSVCFCLPLEAAWFPSSKITRPCGQGVAGCFECNMDP